MRAARREINIFNMSLLDILCGALGAFCFMMLVLFPYWRPGGAASANVEQEKLMIEKELAELRKTLANRPDGASALAQFDQMTQRLQGLQGQLNKALNDAEESKKTIKTLEMRNPLTVAIYWDNSQDVDIFLEPQNFGFGGGKKTERVNPNAKQNANFSDETRTEVTRGPGTELWVSRDAVAGGEQRLYYKLIATNGVPQPANISGYFIYGGRFFRLPNASAAQEKTAVFVGTLKNSADYRITFEAAPALKESFARQLEAEKKPPGENK